MGGKIEAKSRVRRVNGMTIYFRDDRTIYIKSGNLWSVAHRWERMDLNFYRKSWAPFRLRLRRNCDTLTIRRIYQYADDFNITIYTTAFPPSEEEIKGSEDKE